MTSITTLLAKVYTILSKRPQPVKEKHDILFFESVEARFDFLALKALEVMMEWEWGEKRGHPQREKRIYQRVLSHVKAVNGETFTVRGYECHYQTYYRAASNTFEWLANVAGYTNKSLVIRNLD
jgi:hypothetical protein